MNHLQLFALLAVITLTCISVFSLAQSDDNNNNEEPQLTPEDVKNLLQKREEAENQIVDRARSRIGKKMKPAELINYCLNPAKPVDRFELADHFKMKENELGLFVIDKSGQHIGVISAGKTVIHASPGKGNTVVEVPVNDAKDYFPSGWKRIGPDGILKQKYEFRQHMDNLVKDAMKEASQQKQQQQQQQKKRPAEEGCPDCQKGGGGDL